MNANLHASEVDIFFCTEGKEPCILTYESQRDVKLLEWRPNGGKTLSVACKQVSLHCCILITIFFSKLTLVVVVGLASVLNHI